MALPRFLLSQAGNPSGFFANLFAFLFNRGNKIENRLGVQTLNPQAHEVILELGFGGGASFPPLLQTATEGLIVGVEPSQDMVSRARSKWKQELLSNRLQIEQGSADSIPFQDDYFHSVLTVNTVYFWPKLEAGFQEILRVLRPGGRFVLVINSTEMLEKVGFPKMNYRVKNANFYMEQLQQCGYINTKVEEHPSKKGLIFVITGERSV